MNFRLNSIAPSLDLHHETALCLEARRHYRGRKDYALARRGSQGLGRWLWGPARARNTSIKKVDGLLSNLLDLT